METKIKKILQKKNMRIVDLNNRIAEQNDKPITKYLVSEIVNGKRKNYNLITLMKLCKALEVKPSEIIEDDVEVCPPRTNNSTESKIETKSESTEGAGQPQDSKEKERGIVIKKAEEYNESLDKFPEEFVEKSEQPVVIHDGMEYDPTNPEETLGEAPKYDEVNEDEWNEMEGYAEEEVSSVDNSEDVEIDEDFGF
jgi:DNA-binding Xre family transcriptional regulator